VAFDQYHKLTHGQALNGRNLNVVAIFEALGGEGSAGRTWLVSSLLGDESVGWQIEKNMAKILATMADRFAGRRFMGVSNGESTSLGGI